MSGLYIHIPFCKNKCHYCDFYSVASTALKGEVVEAIVKEAEFRKTFFDKPPTTLYFGGGTPSLLTTKELSQIIDKIDTLWSLSDVVEFTVEANPEDLTPEYLGGLRKLGVNRLSIGVQSFSDRILTQINRSHNAQTAIDAVENARKAGFDNISIDLMYGIQTMTLEELKGSLKQAIDLNVEHISAYHLGIEEHTVFGNRLKRGLLSAVDENVSCQHYGMVCSALHEAGYDHYEISNFARSNMISRHNSSYWSSTAYLGLGPSAHSFDGEQRMFNHANNRKYLDTVELGTFFESEQLTKSDHYNEYIMTRLRTSRGIDVNFIAQRFGEEYFLNFVKVARRHIECGNIERQGHYIRIPEENWLVSDTIISDFFYL